MQTPMQEQPLSYFAEMITIQVLTTVRTLVSVKHHQQQVTVTGAPFTLQV
jgi:hypothetical protein